MKTAEELIRECSRRGRNFPARYASVTVRHRAAIFVGKRRWENFDHRSAPNSKANQSCGVLAAAGLCLLAGCSGKGGSSDRAEYAYVAVTEAGLRDHVATFYNKTGVVHNGERVQILERMQSKRFVRVRSPRGEEGWVQERYLADQQTFDEFQRLAEQFKTAPAQAYGDHGRASQGACAAGKKDSLSLSAQREAESGYAAAPGGGPQRSASAIERGQTKRCGRRSG